MAFFIGQVVVCIKRDTWKILNEGECGPVYNGQYTIRSISSEDDGLFLRFEEIVNPPLYEGDEALFWSIYFRPLIERKTDISALEKIARDVSQGKPVRIKEDA